MKELAKTIYPGKAPVDRYRLVELQGTMVQDFRLPVSRGLCFLSGREEIIGGYGEKVWWLPVGDSWGLKMYNKNMALGYERAGRILKMQEDRLMKFLEPLSAKAKKYLPSILELVVVKYTGRFTRGTRRKHQNGFTKGTYLLGWIIQTYELFPRPLCCNEKKRIKAIFSECNIFLHDDTFEPRQVGVDKGKIILLDVSTDKGQKII